jgi:hypothetical protein
LLYLTISSAPIDLAGDVTAATDAVAQAQLDALFAGPKETAEDLVTAFESLAAALFDGGDELLMELIEQSLQEVLVELAERREGIEDALVIAGGEQAALHTQFFHRALKAEAVEPHPDGADQRGCIDVDVVGGSGDIVGA